MSAAILAYPGAGAGSTAGGKTSPPDWRAPGLEAIRQWLADGRERAIDALRPEEIGAALHRGRLLWCALIDGTAHIERRIAPGMRGRESVLRHLLEVVQLDTAYADTDDGMSTVSAPRLAKLIGVGERTVRHGRDLAVELHLLGRMQRPGRGDAYWPIIPRRIVSPHLHPVWWLDATSDIRRGWPRGRPRTPGAAPPAPSSGALPPQAARPERRRQPEEAQPRAYRRGSAEFEAALARAQAEDPAYARQLAQIGVVRLRLPEGAP